MKRSISILLVALAGVALAATIVAADGGAVWRVYPLHYLDVRDAGLLIESRVPEMVMDEENKIRYEVLGGPGQPGETRPRGYLRVLADGGSHDHIAKVLAEADRPPATQVFQLVLLGAVNEAVAPPDLSPGARAALDDLRTLLPFKGYRLIDSAVVRSSGRADLTLGEIYGIEFSFRIAPSGEKPLEVERFSMYSRAINTAQMQTSFSAGIGETVVVRTSTPQDSRGALVLLMTALE